MKQFNNNQIKKKIIEAKNKLKNLSLDYKKNFINIEKTIGLEVEAIEKCIAKKQAVNFLEGKSPPDFVAEDYEVHYTGLATTNDLTSLGKKQMALEC